MRVFQFLLSARRGILTVILIIGLLIGQAFCDLSLPKYTGNIVNIGIMQGGIENAVPDQIRESSMAGLKLFMSEEDAKYVDKYYKADPEGNLRLDISRNDTKIIDKLDSIFTTPMIIMSAGSGGSGIGGSQTDTNDAAGDSSANATGSDNTTDAANATGSDNTDSADNKDSDSSLGTTAQQKIPDISELLKGYQAGTVTSEQLNKIKDEADKQIKNLGDMAGSAAVHWVSGEYEAMGLDLNKIQMDYMKRVGLIMVIFAIFSSLSAVAVCLFASYRAAAIARDLRKGMFFNILNFSGREMEKFSSASLITRSTNDITQIQMALVMSMRMVLMAPIMGIGGIIMVAKTPTGMGWIIGVTVAFLLVVFVGLISFTMPKFKLMQKLIDRVNLVAREILTGLPVIRAFCKEDYEKKRFEAANNDLKKTQLFTMRSMSLMFPVMMFVMNFVMVGIVWYGAKEVDMAKIMVGDMMAFINYTMIIVMSFAMLSMIAVMLPRANVAANRIHDVLATKPSITDKPDDELVELSSQEWKGRIEFDDVSFRYPDADDNILRNISFTAEPGQTTAIIGSTGSGKSTLVNLIPRLFDVTDGFIKIDGVDIRNLRQHDLRSLLGVVPQKGVLFSGDIKSNISFGREGSSEEEIERAAKIAQATEFIEEKDEGYESPIARGGSNVSGGQKQRLSIARAINKDPRVYIFDDSFSALDYKTDTKLRRALAKNVGDATVMIVAQRIATILRADKIIVIDEGEIAGIGTHKELMEGCEVYREIAYSQLNEEELAS